MATPRTWVTHINVTDGTKPLSRAKIHAEVDGKPIGDAITGEDGRVRFELPSPTSEKPKPLQITVTGPWGGSKRTESIDWENAFFDVKLSPPWWRRLIVFLGKLVPKSKTGWGFALVGLILAVYAVILAVSWCVPGKDVFGYNMRCARIAVEAAARTAKPVMRPPDGHVIEDEHLKLQVNVPQYLSHEVKVTFTVDTSRAVPLLGGELSPEAHKFNEAWAEYEKAVREASKNKAPSAIDCVQQEIAELRRLHKAIVGEEATK